MTLVKKIIQNIFPNKIISQNLSYLINKISDPSILKKLYIC